MKEGKIAKQIIVPVKRCDQIQEVLPYLEKIAQPGMRVVFLVSYPVDLASYMSDHWIETESPRRAMLAGSAIMYKYGWEMQRELAERKIDPVRDALSGRGVEVSIVICTRMGKTISDYRTYGNVDLILFHPGSRHVLISLLRRAFGSFGFFKRPGSTPVLLLHPPSET